MTSILLSCDSFPIFKQVAWLLGIVMNAIFELLNLIGIPNIGLAIILFTIFVYLLMMPLTVKQQKFSKLSAKMNPEIQAIQNKYKNRKDTESQMQMNTEVQSVYAKYGVSPSGSCLQLLIQMPILFSLYSVINRMPHYVDKLGEAFDKLANGLMNGNLINDLIKEVPKLSTYIKEGTEFTEANKSILIDALNRADFSDISKFATSHNITDGIADIERYNSFFVKGFSLANSPSAVVSAFFQHNASFIMLVIAIAIPVLSAVTQWINVLLMPKPEENRKGGSEMQDTMASSMKTMNMIMPIMSAFFCYSFPAGLGLYWIMGSVVRSIQQVVINKQIDKMDLNELIEQNKEKSAKKIEKLKENQARYAQYANMNTKNINNPSRNYVNKEATDDKGASTKTTTPSNAKPGSLMARANLVKDYNERNNKN